MHWHNQGYFDIISHCSTFFAILYKEVFDLHHYSIHFLKLQKVAKLHISFTNNAWSKYFGFHYITQYHTKMHVKDSYVRKYNQYTTNSIAGVIFFIWKQHQIKSNTFMHYTKHESEVYNFTLLWLNHIYTFNM